MAKWADFVITAVRFDSARSHITHLEVRTDNGVTLGQPSTLTKAEVVSAIATGAKFVTAVPNRWRLGAEVDIVAVKGERFLRTDRNATTKDNLDNLPEF